MKLKDIMNLLLCSVALFYTACSQAEITNQYPAYLGISGGYGSTNWSGLIDTTDTDPSVQGFLPQSVNDTGFVYGAFLGYDFIRAFGLELRYDRFPRSNMTFVPDANPYNINSMSSSTYAASLVAKFLLPIGESNFAVYTVVGPEYTHRSDLLAGSNSGTPDNPLANSPGSRGRLGLNFGLGFTYQVTSSLFMSVEGDYFTGYGESSALPVNYYIPFLYAVEFKLGYRFSFTHLPNPFS